jgi:peptidoglycan-associated lipoprotein
MTIVAAVPVEEGDAMRSRSGRPVLLVLAVLAVIGLGACGKKVPPVARPVAPPPPSTTTAAPPATPAKPPAPPQPVKEAPIKPPAPIKEDTMSSRTLEELNRESPLKDLFYEYDSAELSADGQKVLDGDAEILKRYSTWVLTIEGHCDERGTAEYNLALGERRAVAARSYLVSLGVPAERLKTVSYGKEFPFDPGHDEAAWAKNRRAHFVITSK